MAEVVRLDDPMGVAQAAGERFLAASLESVRNRGRFVVVLSGGSTPRALHRILASGPLRPRIPWSRTEILFGDERCVRPDHESSNYRMTMETLLDHVRIPAKQIHRIEAELEPSLAASRYEEVLHSLYRRKESPRFDLVLLGVGEDGHTASLFPGTAALEERERLVVANHVPQLEQWRVTMTLPAIRAARRILFLITGGKKARVTAEAFGGLPHDGPYPCELAVPLSGVREILVDRAAGAELPRR